MKNVGDIIQWNTKSGTARGIIEKVSLKVRYIAKIYGSDKYMDLIEDMELSELRVGDPNTEFLQIVQQMRDAQKRYFETKDAVALNESMRLEKKVDAIIELCQSPNLFNGYKE